jgi:hypothetical protein
MVRIDAKTSPEMIVTAMDTKNASRTRGAIPRAVY